MQFPAIIGGVVPVVNIDGFRLAAIRFTGPVLADIYLGKIKKWNEKPIADLNPSLKLPDELITVVRRSDGRARLHLHRLPLESEPEWKQKVGSSTAVSWPEGVGGKGNEGSGRLRAADQGRDRLRRVRVRQAEQDDARRAAEPRRASSCSRRRDRSRLPAAFADWKSAPGFYQILTDQPGRPAGR
jgi:phosphate transport system substrate-binding protein